MANIWVYSEDVSLAKELVTAAKQLGGEVGAIAITEEVANGVAATGINKVVYLKGEATWAEAYGKEIAAVLIEEGAQVVLVGATPKGRAVAAEVSALMGTGLVSDAGNLAIAGDTLEVERFIYGGLAVSHEAVAFPAFATVPARSNDPAADGAATAVTVKEVAVANTVTVVSVESANKGGVDLNKADKVVGFGRGVEGEEGLATMNALADVLGAEVGCTRPIAEEAKLLPVERYIGISGKQLKGSLYIGVGTSGQVQHVAGIRDVKTVVAINSDENAPIMAAADYAIVGDYKAIVPALADAIKAAK